MKRWIERFLLGFLFLISMRAEASAKEAGFSLKDDPGVVTFKDIRLTLPGDWGSVSFFGRDRLRYEAWDYFASATDNDYAFLANQLRLGGKWVHEIFNVNYTHQYTQLSNLPSATSAGAGSGSLYFSNSRNRNSNSQFIKYLNLEIKQTRKLLEPLVGDLKWLRGVTETFGRFNYSSGNEMRSDDKKIEWLKGQRIADRVIGGFEWSHYGRSFDGVKAARADDLSQLTVGYFNPTQGGFEERANRRINDLDVFTAEVDFKKDKLIPGTEAQAFYYHYDDQRNIAATTTRIDNTGRALPSGEVSDVELHTFGGHLVGYQPIGPGQWDLLGWAAFQQGHWFELDQDAYAFAVETGYQLPKASWKPWFRIGYNKGSGDDDPADETHGTFYQMLPTGRLYSFSILYNLMNTEDTFLSLIMKPNDFLTIRPEFHSIRLSEKNDRWYLGSGTMHDNVLDDFAARASNGEKDLGELLDVTLVWNVHPDVTVTAYYGHFFGEEVVKRFFTTHHCVDFGYLEATFQF